MFLAVDIGNTTIGFATFVGEELTERYSVILREVNSLEDAIGAFKTFLSDTSISSKEISDVCISSVVPNKTQFLADAIHSVSNVEAFIITPNSKTDLIFNIDDKDSTGADLICDLVGASTKYGPSTMIIDLGTATKYLLLDKDNAFSGAVISPGLKLSYKALTNGTACLPEIKLELPKKVIAKETIGCINSGILYGTIFEIKGMVEAFEKEVGYKLNKVITGGYTKYIATELTDYIYDPHLIFEGIRAIYLKNKQ